MAMHTETNLLVEKYTEIAFLFVTQVAAPGFLTFISSLIYPDREYLSSILSTKFRFHIAHIFGQLLQLPYK